MTTIAAALNDLSAYVAPGFVERWRTYGREIGYRNLGRAMVRVRERTPKGEALRLQFLADFRTLTETLSEDEEAVRMILSGELFDVERELQRRCIPFGGRAGMRAAEAKRHLGRGDSISKQLVNQFPGIDTPTLAAKREALVEFLGEEQGNEETQSH